MTRTPLRSLLAKRSPLGASLTPTTRDSSVAAGRTRHALWLPVTVAVALLLMPTVQAGLYTQNFSTATVGDTGTSLGDGSNIVGNLSGVASVQNPGSSGNALRLSDESNVGVNSFGNWYLPDFNSGVAVTSFTASFDSLIYKPGTINPANTGDFFGFNFGTITGQTAFSNGNGGIQGPNATNVLTVTFRTFGTNQIQVWYNNSQVGGSIGTPAVSSVVNSGAYQLTTISWGASTGLSVNYGGSSLVSGLTIPGFTPAAGDTFAFNAFTAAATQDVYIGNVSIQTVQEPSTSLIALAGLACGGFSMWRRRKRA